jgi:hypothetical protein
MKKCTAAELEALDTGFPAFAEAKPFLGGVSRQQALRLRAGRRLNDAIGRLFKPPPRGEVDARSRVGWGVSGEDVLS